MRETHDVGWHHAQKARRKAACTANYLLPPVVYNTDEVAFRSLFAYGILRSNIFDVRVTTTAMPTVMISIVHGRMNSSLSQVQSRDCRARKVRAKNIFN